MCHICAFGMLIFLAFSVKCQTALSDSASHMDSIWCTQSASTPGGMYAAVLLYAQSAFIAEQMKRGSYHHLTQLRMSLHLGEQWHDSADCVSGCLLKLPELSAWKKKSKSRYRIVDHKLQISRSQVQALKNPPKKR